MENAKQNKNSPLVSVLMTAYNREKYIGEAIESVLASTYTNFELIVVDDCSTDKTVEIVRKFSDMDPRIIFYQNSKNLGQFQNRNFAASLAKGKYLKYIDSDDLIYSHGLEVLVRMMEDYPDAGYGLCSIDQNREQIYPFLLSEKDAYKAYFFDNISIFDKAPLSSIIKKDAFDKVNGFTNFSGEGDYEMWLKLSCHYPVLLMPHGIVWYRTHREQINFNRLIDPSANLRYMLVTLKYMNGLAPLNKVERNKVIEKTQNTMARYITKKAFNHSVKKAKEMYLMSNFTFFTFCKSNFKYFFQKYKP